jgi:hypothetical protein
LRGQAGGVDVAERGRLCFHPLELPEKRIGATGYDSDDLEW